MLVSFSDPPFLFWLRLRAPATTHAPVLAAWPERGFLGRRRLRHCGCANLCRCRYRVSLIPAFSIPSTGGRRRWILEGAPALYFWICRLLRAGDLDLSFVSILAASSFSTSTGVRSRSSSARSGCQGKGEMRTRMGDDAMLFARQIDIYNLEFLQLKKCLCQLGGLNWKYRLLQGILRVFVLLVIYFLLNAPYKTKWAQNTILFPRM